MSHWNRRNYRMVVRNLCTAVTDHQLAAMIDAVQQQILRDVYPSWGLKAELRMIRKAARVPSGVMIINVRDKSDVKGTAGYHWTEDGLPVTYVFAKDDMAHGRGLDGLSSTLSHEVIEMLVDPEVNLYAMGVDPKDRRKKALFPYEACDPVQGNRYRIGGVAVSDFVFPEWFEPERPEGERFNHTDTLKSAFSLAPKGYARIFELASRSWTLRFGPKRKTSPSRHRSDARSHPFRHPVP
jgi:hypothetical protein